ncbi:MAG: hypothetical protein J6K45_07505 [Clostridia bacterium]|nr:hypothetical protein [Clostridia bacterium]
MKVLLFTHGQDIDGAGCAILLRKAFDDYKIVPTKTFDITSNVKRYIDEGLIYEYDKVFVTDLCIKEPLLSKINLDEVLKNKIIVIDHHKTEIDEGNDKYSFVTIIVQKNGKKVSGTSLFYEYLLKNGFLKKDNILDQLVEWTRQYDIWDWKKENNYDARKLHILFEMLGFDKYLELMNKKVDNSSFIDFDEFEKTIINEYDQNLGSDITKALKDMKVVSLKIDDNLFKIGYVTTLYKYRNDVNEFVKKDNVNNIDAVGMIMKDTETVSYRQVKDVDVSCIAKYFNGKGHREASTNLQNNEKFIKVLNENNY